MSWTWSYDPDGTGATPAEEFGNQSDAESWVGENWRELAEAGVVAVHLYEDTRKILWTDAVDGVAAATSTVGQLVRRSALLCGGSSCERGSLGTFPFGHSSGL